jgi:NADH:ubiquinone reductase (H+-translocating)
MAKDRKPHHFVIVGGGAGGLELAVRLSRRFAKDFNIHITLVDAELTHLWKPLWHEVAAGTLNSYEDELNYMAYAYANHFHFELGKMQGLNRHTRQVELAPVFGQDNLELIPRRLLHYDTLVIAVGSISNDFNVPGVVAHCHFLDSRQQVENFHQYFLANLMHTYSHRSNGYVNALQIAIIGGGATGVELAAELHYAIIQAVRYSGIAIDPQKLAKITLIEAADTILASLPARVIKATQQFLIGKGITIYEAERVNRVTPDGLHMQSGLFIPAQLKVWAAGIKAPGLLCNMDGLALNHLNQLLVYPTMQTTLDENIFALGDCASCPQPLENTVVPPRAQAAHQQASLLAKSLHRRIHNKPLLIYRYRDYGSLISLSRYTAIGTLMGFKGNKVMLEGKFARLTYLMLYKMHQIALFGLWRVSLLTGAQLLTQAIKPRLKLH